MIRKITVGLVLVGLAMVAVGQVKRGPVVRPAPGRPAVGLPGRGGPAAKKVSVFDQFNKAQVAFVAVVENVKYGPVAMSMPPIYSLTITFSEVEALRGTPGEKPSLSYSARQKAKPTFPKGSKMLVAAASQQGRMRINTIIEASEENVAEARKGLAVPIGWSFEKGKVVSPWSKFGDNAWPKGAKPTSKTVCSKTGRPSLLAGQAVELTAKFVPPVKEVKWRNPNGDGEFTVTVTNTSDKPVTVPALLARGEGANQKILWAESLFALNAGKAFFLPGAGQVPADVHAATLKPNESVSTVINTLRFVGVTWPRGGYRIYFQLCLGELSAEAQFYYYSKHHDPIRKALSN